MLIKYTYPAVLCLFAASAHAEQQLITAGLSIQEYWDSNFSRNHDEVREEITLTSASISLDKKLSRQQIAARWKGTEYNHDLREDLDGSVQVGEISWDGEWGKKWRTEVSVLRDAYAVDRLEFFDKDIVTRDDAIIKIGYGSGNKLALYVGGRHTKQHHSAALREGLDFDEDEGLIEFQYQTAQQSLLVARYKVGERQYPNPGLENSLGQLDFDYQQVEFESTIQLTPKTQLNSVLAYFERDGFINDDHGALATLGMTWDPSEKLQVKTGYLLKQPAVGELSDSPSDIERVFLSSEWQWTHKIRLSANAYYEQQTFDGIVSIEREEKLSVISPFNLTYDYSENISIRINSEWEDRESPLPYRDYTSLQGRLGVFLRF